MININFLVGMPRAGNTILSSILNQNPNVKMSAHSILPTLLDSILQIKNHERFLNFGITLLYASAIIINTMIVKT